MSFILKKIVTNEKINFWNFTNFFTVGVGVILFIPRTVSKHKIQLLPSKVCAIWYLSKERVANPHPLKKFSQNIIKLKKNFWKFFIFFGGGEGWGGSRGNFIHFKNSFTT